MTGTVRCRAVQIEPGPSLRTERLLLRRWKPADRRAFAALNADPAVMEFFPRSLTPGESDAFAERADAAFERGGFGLFAVEEIGGAPFVGFVGLNAFTAEEPSPLPFAPGVEVGWRLARAVWGQGYAPEAARACLAFGFGQLGLEEIVSFTSVVNERSQQVMRKIGMQRDPADDFEHPRVPLGSALRPHVLYRLRREGGPAASVSSGEP
jgi:RimJ/RimL family protein N-acetyltransferase